MKNKAWTLLTYFALIVVGLYFFFSGLVEAKSFLAPLSLAALLAMVMLPVCRWFEKKGINRGWASLFSDLIILLFFVLLSWVVTTQISSLAEDWPKIRQRLEPKIEQMKQFMAANTGMSMQEMNQKIDSTIPGDSGSSEKQGQGSSQEEQGQPSGQSSQQGENQQQSQEQSGSSSQQQSDSSSQQQSGSSSQQQSGSSMLSTAGNFLGQFLGFLGDFLLTFVYIFFFLLYRTKFRKSILKMVPEEKKPLAKKVITDSAKVSQNYLFGRLLLILFLAILYSVGLSISGVKHAILISVLAAVLSLIPYIGNMVGFVLAAGMALFSGSGATGVVGVSITFGITQFVESYILEPYIVGDKVDLNPVFTIIVVVLGGAVWGVMGMLIAIPALGIVKVVFDHIPVLQPIGYLFGEEDTKDKDEDKDNIFKKTKRWALQKFQR